MGVLGSHFYLLILLKYKHLKCLAEIEKIVNFFKYLVLIIINNHINQTEKYIILKILYEYVDI